MANNHFMSQESMLKLKGLTLAPYIQLSIALIDKPRKCLGNIFRHQHATFCILIDYGYTDHILLKASIIHDLIEDIPDFDRNRIIELEDGQAVLDLVLEVSKRPGERKDTFLRRIKDGGSYNAKVLKCADRISNLYDLGFVSDKKFLQKYLDESEKHILPMAEEVNQFMVIEIKDLIKTRALILERME